MGSVDGHANIPNPNSSRSLKQISTSLNFRYYYVQVVITVDVLRRGGVTTVLGGLAGFSLVECSRGVKLFPDALLEDALKMGPFDIIIIPDGSVE